MKTIPGGPKRPFGAIRGGKVFQKNIFRSGLSWIHKHRTSVTMGADTNCRKLQAIAKAFDLSPVLIARTVGVSRPYISRILSEADSFSGSPEFWSAMEKNLGRVIDARRGQVFAVEALHLEQVEAVQTLRSVA